MQKTLSFVKGAGLIAIALVVLAVMAEGIKLGMKLLMLYYPVSEETAALVIGQ